MAQTVSYVSTGKPEPINGAIFRAPVGTSLPVTATESLDASFVALGYCSQDGMTNSNSMETSEIAAWGGDIVLTPWESRNDTFTFTLIETLNVDVLETVYGSANVTGDLATGIAVSADSSELDALSWVIDMIMRDGAIRRIVIPNGKITEMGDISYTDSDAVGYEITITAFPDSAGKKHYEYTVRADSSAS